MRFLFAGAVLILCAAATAQSQQAGVTDDQIKFYADTATKAYQAVEKVRQQAIAAANNYREIAELRCRQKLETNGDYHDEKQAAADAQRVIEQGRTLNNVQMQNTASAQLDQANEQLKKMEATALEADADVQAAKAMLAQIDPSSAPPPAVAVETSARAEVAPPQGRTIQYGQQPGTAYPTRTMAPGTPPPQVDPAVAKAAEEAYRQIQQKAGGVTSLRRPTGEALGRMIHDGWDGLMAKRYADAALIFDRTAGSDSRDTVSLLGRGICKYELSDYKAADRDLEKAYGVASAGGPTRVPRQLIIAAAAAKVMNGNPVRGVKMIMDTQKWMESNGKTDEELQNDLGIALSHVDAQARILTTFQDSLKYYLDYDQKLNRQKNDGTARWGTEWIDAASAQQKWQAYAVASKSVEQATLNFHRAGLARVHAYDNYLEVVGGLRLHTVAETTQRTNEYLQSKQVEASAQAQMDAAIQQLNSIEKPPFPDRIEHDWSEPR